uniref:Uncharacterized protein n=1 Tax=Setaria viridis TaxID=4556 RepID=A0A4U6V9V0_SETVI|nr:hypothetical protein SEVIR_3G163280v2 [Setaria viridis]
MERGRQIRRLIAVWPCLKRAGPLSVPCPCRHYGPNWRPRHGTNAVPGLALARWFTGRAIFGPCFFVSCSGRPVVLVPNGNLRHVCFSCPSRPEMQILRDLNLRIPSGKVPNH